MDNRPLVTVIIPVFNAGAYLRPAVESIINQTYSNLEIIIIDDGSTDNCINTITDIIKQDSRVLLISQKNAGKAAALNRAVINAVLGVGAVIYIKNEKFTILSDKW